MSELGAYRSYGLTGLPETFFIDRAGRVRIHWIGEIKSSHFCLGQPGTYDRRIGRYRHGCGKSTASWRLIRGPVALRLTDGGPAGPVLDRGQTSA